MKKKSNEHTPEVNIENGQGIVIGDKATVNQTFIKKVFNGINENVFKRFANNMVLAIVVVGIISTVGLLIIILLLTPKKDSGDMTGDFNIAVAGFAVLGNPGEKDLGKVMAENVFLHLETNLEETSSDLKIVSSDLKIQIWNPEKVGSISGRTRDQRADSAEKLAKQINASIIVYGLVDTTHNPWVVTPEFFISGQSFSDAQEIVGQYEIGSPFTIPGQDNIVSRLELSNHMSSRVKALSIISVGLSYFAVYQYDLSLSILKSALEIENWQDDQGREVLFLLLGNAASKAKQFSEAEQYYRESLEIDPEYARAHIGMGSINYINALSPFELSKKPEDVDNNLLDLSIQWYRGALEAENRPALADIETKVHFGIGQCYLMKVYSGQEKWFDQAVLEFQAVIDEYGDGKNMRVRELAAESHARLGLIYNLSGNTEMAITEYEQAANIISDYPERQKVWLDRVEKLRAFQLTETSPSK